MSDQRQEERRERILTDADVKAIAEELEEALKRSFYQNLGKGLWGVAWKVLLGALLMLAAYGVGKGGST